MFQKWFLDLKAAFLRFPLAVALCLINAALAVYLFEMADLRESFWPVWLLVRLLFSLICAILLSTIARLFLEGNGFLRRKNLENAENGYKTEILESQINSEIQENQQVLESSKGLENVENSEEKLELQANSQVEKQTFVKTVKSWSFLESLPYLLPLLAIPFFFVLPRNEDDFTVSKLIFITVTYLVLAVLCFLAPFLRLENPFSLSKIKNLEQENLPLWRFINSNILHLILASVFNGIIILGIFLIFLALQLLLNFNFNSTLMAQIFMGVSLSFWPIFFLALVPKNFYLSREAEAENELIAVEKETQKFNYPQIYRILGNFILLPIWVVYTLVLLIYSARILLSWQWPIGQTVPLILVSLFSGAFILLLTLPQNNRFILIFQKVFASTALILLPVYFLAINMRLEFGLTESRYFVVLWGIFFALAALFSLWKISLKFYGFLFIILAIFSILPAVGAFDLSVFSQQKALETILENNNLLENGKIQKAGAGFSKETEQEISRKIEYLGQRGQEKYLQERFLLPAGLKTPALEAEVLNSLNLEYRPYEYYNPKDTMNYINLESPSGQKVELENYKAFYKVYSEGNYVRDNKLILSRENLEIEILTPKNKEFLLKAKSGTQEQMIFIGKVQNSPVYQEYKLVITQISYNLEPENTAKPIEILNLEAFVFLR